MSTGVEFWKKRVKQATKFLYQDQSWNYFLRSQSFFHNMRLKGFLLNLSVMKVKVVKTNPFLSYIHIILMKS